VLAARDLLSGSSTSRLFLRFRILRLCAAPIWDGRAVIMLPLTSCKTELKLALEEQGVWFDSWCDHHCGSLDSNYKDK